MNIKLEILHPSEHKELIYTPQNCYSNMAKRLLAPLLFSELIEAARCYPIIFYLSKGDEKLTPMALLGTEPARGNVSITEQGKWMESRMIPASISSYPFYPGHIDENGQLTLLIDRHAPHFQQKSSDDNTGQPLFTPTGEATPTLKNIRKKHLNYQKEMGHTDWVVYKLYEKNLFQTKKLSEFLPGEKVAQLSNFFVLDQKKLEELPDEDFLELRQLGLMVNLYALITSQNNFSLLSKSTPHISEPSSYTRPEEVSILTTEPVTPEKTKDNRLFLVIAVAIIGILSGVIIHLNSSINKNIAYTQVVKKATEVKEVKEVSKPKLNSSKTEVTTHEKQPQSAKAQTTHKEEILNILTLPPNSAPPLTDSKVKQQDMELSLDNSSVPVETEQSLPTSKKTDEMLVDSDAENTTTVVNSPKTLTPPEVKQEITPPNQVTFLIEQPLPDLSPKKRPLGQSSPSPFKEQAEAELLEQQSPHVNILIDGIKRNITESRLSLPRGDNALEKVAQLQELNIDSPIVEELLNTVFERFLELAIWDRSGRAKLYLEKAGKIFPGDPRIEEIEGLVSE
ncbi:MAG: SapC family protein [Magnetococcales bacterium]|nr:SapC family protein [Magnetococcales bacterium]